MDLERPKKKEKRDNNEQNDFEAKQNLSGFFELLLKVDMRNHPEIYKQPNNSAQKND